MAGRTNFQGGDQRHLSEAVNRLIEGEEEAAPPPEEDIRIDVPQEAQVKPEVYRDVERMIYRGFLTIQCEIAGVRFVFKSINHHEFDNIQMMTGGASQDEYFYTLFIVHGVLMVEGVNILSDRTRWFHELETMFSGFPPPAKSKIVQYLGDVNRRASNAVTLTEAYQMEVSSRFRWAQLKGLDLMSPTCTGVYGTERLGMNFAQLVWRALNHYEDVKEGAERDWDHAKFIGGCFVGGKEMRKVHNQDQERRKKDREQRLERKDKVLRQVLLGEDPEQETKSGPIKIVAKTIEELAGQLERGLRGEKDWHDEIIAREEARIRRNIAERQQKLQELVLARNQSEDRRLSAYSSLEGLTPEEVQQRLLRKRQLEAQENASKIVFPEMMDERMENFMRKYIDPDDTYRPPEVVRTQVRSTERDPSEAQPISPPRTPGTPFRRG